MILNLILIYNHYPFFHKVTEENLPEYLSEKKKQGYALLGVEQTNDSVNLNKFSFPEKSVLLLGKI